MSTQYSGFKLAGTVIRKAGVVVFSLTLAVVVQAQSFPDFTVLVEKNAPAIVNVSTTYAATENSPQQRQELEDLLKYYFGDRAPQLQLPDPNEQQPEEGGATGSGFIIDSDGYIVTNHHVIADAKTVKVTLNDQREFTATVVGSDERSDLAVLKIDASKLPTVKLGESEKLKVGEWVLAIGSPFGLQYSVAAGIISYMGRSLPTEGSNYVSYIQTDVAINPGHSGGPLFNMAGEVIGINSQIFTNSGGSIGLSFAIPVDVAKNVVAQLRDGGKVQRGYMGVGIDNVSQDLADAFGLDRPHGALVNDVIKGGPAEAAGFETGDVILKFNGHDIRTRDDLPYFVGLIKPGTSVPVEIVRKGSPQTLKMTVGNLDEGASLASQNAPAAEAESRLGLKVVAIDAKQREQLDLEAGVVVESVSGPAQEARLQPGDIIVSLNGVDLHTPAELATLESSLPVNRPLPVLVVRDERQTFFTIRINE
jgi:serine protease Do